MSNSRTGGEGMQQSAWPAVHPDVIVRIDVDAAYLAEHPVVRQGLRPVWIGFKLRRVLSCGAQRQGEENDSG
jgi:hypothetical protein